MVCLVDFYMHGCCHVLMRTCMSKILAVSVLTAAYITKKQVSIFTCSGSTHQCITVFRLKVMQITDFDLATDPCFE